MLALPSRAEFIRDQLDTMLASGDLMLDSWRAVPTDTEVMHGPAIVSSYDGREQWVRCGVEVGQRVSDTTKVVA